MKYDEDYSEDYDAEQHWCTECGEECHEEVTDEGIGPYEFWGARGCHVDKRVVSSCCEAETTTVNLEEYGDDE